MVSLCAPPERRSLGQVRKDLAFLLRRSLRQRRHVDVASQNSSEVVEEEEGVGGSAEHDEEHRGSFAENRDPNSNGNGNLGNLAAMKRIMQQKRAMAQDARREMGSS